MDDRKKRNKKYVSSYEKALEGTRMFCFVFVETKMDTSKSQKSGINRSFGLEIEFSY